MNKALITCCAGFLTLFLSSGTWALPVVPDGYTCQLHKLSAWERFRFIKSSIIWTEQHVA